MHGILFCNMVPKDGRTYRSQLALHHGAIWERTFVHEGHMGHRWNSMVWAAHCVVGVNDIAGSLA